MEKKDYTILCRVSYQDYLDFLDLRIYISKMIGMDLNNSDTLRWLIKNFPKEDISDV